jgi:hypothetical protein
MKNSVDFRDNRRSHPEEHEVATFMCRLRCSAVLADQATHDTPTLDPGSDVDGAAGLAQREFLLLPPVRPVAIILPRTRPAASCRCRAEDQHVIQALAARRPHETLRVRIRPRRPDGRLDHPRAVPGEDTIERGGELETHHAFL